MTVAFDSIAESAEFTTTTPHTFTGPTPVGTPRSVTVGIAWGTDSTDHITGAVTYGGVAMTRVDVSLTATTEPGGAVLYHLGAGIPAGAQTVSITHDGSATVKWACCVLDTAAGDTEIVVSDKTDGTLANPQLALDTGATSSLRRCILYSGVNAPGSATPLSGMEAVAAANANDFGAFCAFMGLQTTASTGSFTIGYTIASDDAALVAAAIQEAPLAMTGTIAVTQANQTSAISGTVLNPITGTIGVTQASDTGAIIGLESFTGTIGATQADQTAAISGSVAPAVTGTIGVTQEDDTADFQGDAVTDGILSAIQDDQVGAFTGDVINPITGVLGAIQEDDTGAFVGEMFGFIVGNLAATQANQTMTASGSVINLVAGTVSTVTCVIGGPTLACTISPVSVIAGSNFIVTATFRDAMGDLANPTSVSAVIQAPDGTQTTPTPTSSSVGVWTTVVPTDQAGFWFYQISGAGNEIDVVCHGSVCVEPALVLV